MAISIVTSVDGGTTSGFPASKTYAFNVTETGANHCLVVFVWAGNYTFDDISGVTYNGNALTRDVYKYQSNGNKLNSYIYRIMNPNSGNNNIVISTGSNNEYVYSAAVLLSGVDSSSPLNTTGSNGATTGTSLSVSLTTTVSNCVGIVGASGANNISPDSGLTRLQPTSGQFILCNSTSVLANGANTLNLTMSSTGVWNTVGIALAPAPTTFIPQIIIT
jgi:hypothetical protein